MIVVYFISFLVLRNIQDMKKDAMLVYRSMGTKENILSWMNILELIIYASVAYLVMILLMIINEFELQVLPLYLRYYNLSHYLFMYIILIGLAVLLGRKFNKRLFSKSVISSLKGGE